MASLLLPFNYTNTYIPQTNSKRVECPGIYEFVLHNRKWIEKELDTQIELISITKYNKGVSFVISPDLPKKTILIYTLNIDHPNSHQDHCMVWKDQEITITKENKDKFDISTSEWIIKDTIKYYNDSKIVQDTIINLYTMHKRNEKINQLI